MSDMDKKALDNIAESVKQMDEAGKAEFAAFSEGLALGVKLSADKAAS